MSRQVLGSSLVFTLALSVLFVLIVGNALHALVPHVHSAHVDSHEHSHPGESVPQESESPVWASLHSSLRHEDKKYFTTILLLTQYALAFQFQRTLVIHTDAMLRRISDAHYEILKPNDSNVGRWLSNGISPYRRFG